MEVICKNCQSKNLSSALFCSHCKLPLKPYQQITKTLYERVGQVENEYQTKLGKLKEELNLLAKYFESGQPEAGSIPNAKPLPKPLPVKEPILATELIPKTEPVKKEVNIPKQPVLTPRPAREPSALELQIQSFLKPFTDGITWVSNLYGQYKSEGKLPIFLMTIAGIIAILFGFGYLMQVTFEKMGDFGPLLKVSLGFISALAIIIIALRLYRKKDKYGEYASALASLGIILNYLMIYFLSDLGNFPLLSSSILGFGLILLNTAFAIFLSLRFQTKIVAVLSLIGGAFTPFYLNSTSDGTLYFAYLWLLVFAANVVAQKINWKTLHYLSFIVGVSLFGFNAFSYSPNTTLFTIYYHLFSYLFFYYTFFAGKTLKEELDKTEIFLLAGNVSFLLFSLYTNYPDQYLILGIIYLVNAALFGTFTGVFWNKLSTQLKRILPVIIASFIGVAIPSLFGQSLVGLFWSIEAILLIQLGFISRMPIVRKEGYLVLLVGLFKMGYSIFLIVDLPYFLPWDSWYLNLVSLVIVLGILWRQFQHYRIEFVDFEKQLSSFFNGLFPIMASLLLLVTVYNVAEFWAFPVAVVPMLGLAWWGHQFKSKFVTAFSFMFLPFMLVAFPVSALRVDSIHFRDLELFAKLTIILALASLWFSKKFFELIGVQKGGSMRFSQALRVLFFLIISLLPAYLSKRHFPEFIGLTLWLSILIPYGFYKLLSYKALIVEFYLLFVTALVYCSGDLDIASLSAGVFAIVLVHLIERSSNEVQIVKSAFRHFLYFSPYVGILLLVIIPYLIFEIMIFSILAYATLLLILLAMKEKLVFMKALTGMGVSLAIFINLANVLIMNSIHSENDFYVILGWVNMFLIAWVLINRFKWYPSYKSAKWSIDLIFSQLVLIILYATTLYVLGISFRSIIFSILLAVHAVGLVFISLKHQLKTPNYLSIVIFVLALLKVVFNDIASLPTTQKVIVLIAIGALLLGAAYFYTRLKKHFEEKSIVGDLEKKTTEIDQ